MSESTSSGGNSLRSDAESDSGGQFDADLFGQFDTHTLLFPFVISSSESLSFSEVVCNLFRASSKVRHLCFFHLASKISNLIRKLAKLSH